MGPAGAAHNGLAPVSRIYGDLRIRGMIRRRPGRPRWDLVPAGRAAPLLATCPLPSEMHHLQTRVADSGREHSPGERVAVAVPTKALWWQREFRELTLAHKLRSAEASS